MRSAIHNHPPDAFILAKIESQKVNPNSRKAQQRARVAKVTRWSSVPCAGVSLGSCPMRAARSREEQPHHAWLTNRSVVEPVADHHWSWVANRPAFHHLHRSHHSHRSLQQLRKTQPPAMLQDQARKTAASSPTMQVGWCWAGL